MIKYYGYTEEEIKSLSQNNQELGQIQERMELLKYDLFMMKIRSQVDDMNTYGVFHAPLNCPLDIMKGDNASALEKAYRKGYYDALQKQAESEG